MPNFKRKKIILLSPFHSGSHRQWAEGLAANSSHDIHLLKMPGRHWKWRMHGAAIHFSKELLKIDTQVDAILGTDMLDMSTLRALCERNFPSCRFMTYFHENQLTYPWSPKDMDVKAKRDVHYGFINYSTALASDALFFNSKYHKESFISALESMLKSFPDKVDLSTIEDIDHKSRVLALGLDLESIEQGLSELSSTKTKTPVLLWNHRWEYDKNPELFFNTLIKFKKDKIDFKLIVLGESFKDSPKIFKEARNELADRIIHWGYTSSRRSYLELMGKADLIPVTSNQDFFGGSIIEAIMAGVFPLLPNRLAYPEHIPDGLKALCIYEKGQFEYSLLKLIKSYKDYYPNTKLIQNHVKKYNWKSIVKLYDEYLAN